MGIINKISYIEDIENSEDLFDSILEKYEKFMLGKNNLKNDNLENRMIIENYDTIDLFQEFRDYTRLKKNYFENYTFLSKEMKNYFEKYIDEKTKSNNIKKLFFNEVGKFSNIILDLIKKYTELDFYLKSDNKRINNIIEIMKKKYDNIKTCKNNSKYDIVFDILDINNIEIEKSLIDHEYQEYLDYSKRNYSSNIIYNFQKTEEHKYLNLFVHSTMINSDKNKNTRSFLLDNAIIQRINNFENPALETSKLKYFCLELKKDNISQNYEIPVIKYPENNEIIIESKSLFKGNWQVDYDALKEKKGYTDILDRYNYITKLENIANISKGYNITKKDYAEKGNFKIINLSDITEEGNINYDNLSEIAVPAKTLEKFHIKYGLKQGDILLSIRGRIGQVAYVEKNVENLSCSSNFAIIRVKEKEEIIPKFLFYFLKNNDVNTAVQSLSRGKNNSNINYKDLLFFKVIVPNIDFQKKYVAKIEEKEKIIIETKKEYYNILHNEL